VLPNVFGRPGQIKPYFGATPATGRKNFIVDTGHFVPVCLAGLVNRNVDSRLEDRFPWFKLRRHFENGFLKLRRVILK
jgi:hypothetical protein